MTRSSSFSATTAISSASTASAPSGASRMRRASDRPSCCDIRARRRPATRIRDLVICQDIAPTLLALAGERPGPQIQGRSLLPLLAGKRSGWRKSFLIEYWAENALPWLVGMSYKAVRTDRHKLIHWVNRGRAGELDELYDLDARPIRAEEPDREPAPMPHVRDRLRQRLEATRRRSARPLRSPCCLRRGVAGGATLPGGREIRRGSVRRVPATHCKALMTSPRRPGLPAPSADISACERAVRRFN